MTRTALILGLVCAASGAQSARFEKGPQWIEIVLERHDFRGWRTIDAGLVLNRDDLVRFRFRTDFAGYLYVINSGTSGTRSLLFPAEESGTNNQFAASTDYLVYGNACRARSHTTQPWLCCLIQL